MKEVMKTVSLLAVGSAMTIAYQRYNKPMMCAMKKAVNNTKKAAEDKLEEMM